MVHGHNDGTRFPPKMYCLGDELERGNSKAKSTDRAQTYILDKQSFKVGTRRVTTG